MGTRSEVRGLGAGAALVEEAGRWAARQGAHWLWCDAREVALGFYARMGFDFVSETYDVPEIGPHRMMVRRLGWEAGR
jgi:GNAT superfamily N-acetyltransferase